METRKGKGKAGGTILNRKPLLCGRLCRQGGRPKENGNSMLLFLPPDINKMQSSRWQSIADIPEDGGKPTQNGRLSLSEVGIGYHDSPRYRILARVPEDRGFENVAKNSRVTLL